MRVSHRSLCTKKNGFLPSTLGVRCFSKKASHLSKQVASFLAVRWLLTIYSEYCGGSCSVAGVLFSSECIRGNGNFLAFCGVFCWVRLTVASSRASRPCCELGRR